MPEQNPNIANHETMIRLSGSITKVTAIANWLLPFLNGMVVKDKTYPARRIGWVNRYITISTKDETNV